MQLPVTHAVLVEPADAGGLQPLLARRAFAMLPLANRPLIHHQLAQLASAGIREVDLYLSHHPSQTRDFVADGSAWGLHLRCHSVGDTERTWRDPASLRRMGCASAAVLGLEKLPDADSLAWLCQPGHVGSCRLQDCDGTPLRALRQEPNSVPHPETAPGRVRALTGRASFLPPTDMLWQRWTAQFTRSSASAAARSWATWKRPENSSPCSTVICTRSPGDRGMACASVDISASAIAGRPPSRAATVPTRRRRSGADGESDARRPRRPGGGGLDESW